jgi:hypothetical protein
MNELDQKLETESVTYDTDFHAWAYDQARRVRAGEPLDVENVAEQLEDLGKSQQQQLESRLIVLLAHMLKWEFQPRKRTRSWEGTIKEQRRRILRLLKLNPSLKHMLAQCVEEAYQTAVIVASTETRIVEDDFPDTCQYSEETILNG